MIEIVDGMHLIVGDTHISKWSKDYGRVDHDGHLLPYLLHIIQPGDTVLDVGAFIGDHSAAYVRRVGAAGRVIAFEPEAEAFACLRGNAPGAEAHNAAALESRRSISLEVLDNRGMTHLASTPGSIPGFPIDDLDLERLDFMKVDAEGCELLVLQGAARTIERCKPALCLEVNPTALARYGTTPDAIHAWLQARGYFWRPVHEADYHHARYYDLVARQTPWKRDGDAWAPLPMLWARDVP